MPKKIQLNREISYLISFIFVCIFFSMIHLSSLGQWIYYNHDLGYFYKGRKVLGSETKIDPRLKIYLFDDITASSLKDSGISAQRWLEIFRSISKQNPKVIITPNPFNIVKNLHDPIEFHRCYSKNRHKNCNRRMVNRDTGPKSYSTRSRGFS